MNTYDEYAIVVMPLSDEDGGGHVARVPDLPGCFGDGRTAEAAVRNAKKAIVEWVDEYARMGREVPSPGSFAAEQQRNREEERQSLKACLKQLRDGEAEWDDIESRIASLEAQVTYLTELIEDSGAWERFHVITRTKKAPRVPLHC